MHSYRELTAPELVTAFAALGGRINKGRDAHMLSAVMKERGATPTQLLFAMYLSRDTFNLGDIPGLLNDQYLGIVMANDLLLTEAYLACEVTGQETSGLPIMIYRDLLEQDIPSAQNEAAFQQAKLELEEFVGNALSKPCTLGSRSRAARKYHQPRPLDSGPG